MNDVQPLSDELRELRARLADAEQALSALCRGEAHAIAREADATPVLLRAAQEKLRESERLWRAVFDGAVDAMLLADDSGRYVDANPAACALFGITREELIERSTGHASQLHCGEAWAELLRDGRLDGQPRITRADGSWSDLESRTTAHILPGLHLSILRDVTEARRAESRFRALIERSTDVIMLLKADASVAYASPAIALLLGHVAEELKGDSFFALVHVDDLARMREEHRFVLDEPTHARTSELRMRHRDGSFRSVEAVVKNVLEEPAIQALIVNFRDITDRQRALQAQARLAAIVESSQDAIISKDRDYIITSWNAGAARLYQWSAEEVIGQSSRILTPAALLDEERQIMARILRGETVEPYDTTRLRKDGSMLEVAITVSPIRDSSGVIVGISKTARDLSERRKAEAHLRRTEEQLHQAQKMEAIGVLAGGIAHDFNNMLSVILSYASLSLADVDPATCLHEDLMQIQRAGQRATELTRQLLAFSRRQLLQPRVLDLNQVARGMESMVRRLLGEDIELSLLLGPALGRVHADPGQVEQVIMNLVVNARDAMPRGGKLSLETRNEQLDDDCAAEHHGVLPAGQYVMLAVSDTGVGMDVATRERIFEPFFTTKGVGKGTGLGLSTVFGIVKQSGGHIWVYSEPGHGATCKVYFPRTDRTLERLAPPSLVPTLHGSETILLVEDDEQVRTISRTILTRNGYHVLDAQNGGEAFLICEQFGGNIHLLVTDVVMPRMSGRELAERLAPMYPEMRVLYVSGYAEDAIVHHGVIEADIAFLQKPITPDALCRRVRAVLDG